MGAVAQAAHSVTTVQANSMLSSGVEQLAPPLASGTHWGLDRLDQRALGLTDTYDYKTPAASTDVAVTTHVYVIDSGINPSDADFSGRVVLGPNKVSTEAPSRPDSSDCPAANHGTPVAGLIGGDKFGVAKTAVLVSVRAFNCQKQSERDDVVSAFEWVRQNAIRPAVISFSLNRECFDGSGQPAPCPAGGLDDIIAAEQSAIAAGIPVVSGAGDQGIDPCSSPNWAAGAIVVGAVGPDDTRLPTSNFGQCVNIWAPGQSLMSDSVDPNGNKSFTGTAFAAAYVTGAVAPLLSDGQFAAVPAAQLAARVAAQLDANSTLGLIKGLPVDAPNNKLLFVPPTTEGSSIALAKNNTTGRLAAFGTDAHGLMYMNTEKVPGGVSWNGWDDSAFPNWLSVGADNLGDGRFELLGVKADTDEVWQRRQLSLANPPAFTGPSQIDGRLRSVAAAREKDSLLQLVGVNKEGQVWHAPQTNPDASINPSITPAFSAWQQFTGLDNAPLPAFTSVAAEADSNGIVNVFAVDTHGRIWRSQQASVNSAAWFTLVPFAAPPPGNQLSDEMLAGEVAVARDGTGRLDVIATSPQGVMHTLQTTPGLSLWTNPWKSAIFQGSA
ncbi:S8 family serine peptidase [Kribbella sp. NBC_00359]|uniref:S8 family serine peptidase n=1 Tax=Kribbella sp. NBC_00359 TaxID=2975966 RepID=UPI002E1A3817